MAYQRARRPEQKEERREAILQAARSLAAESSVREVSLGDVSRRVELAKSNLLRYYESREDIFLALLEREWDDWLAAASGQMTADAGDVLARTLGERPLFCDLVTEMAAVLERNVSAERVQAFKLANLERVDALAEVVKKHTKLKRPDAREVVAVALVLTAGTYPLSNPAAHVRDMLDAVPELKRAHVDFEGRLRRVLRALIAGFRRVR